jgi:hypothetical protein
VVAGFEAVEVLEVEVLELELVEVAGFFAAVEVVVDVGFFAVGAVSALSVPVAGGLASAVGSGAEVTVGVGAGAGAALTAAAGAGGAGSPFDIIAKMAPPPIIPTRIKPPIMNRPAFDFFGGIDGSAAATSGAPRGDAIPSGAGEPRGEGAPRGANAAGAGRASAAAVSALRSIKPESSPIDELPPPPPTPRPPPSGALAVGALGREPPLAAVSAESEKRTLDSLRAPLPAAGADAAGRAKGLAATPPELLPLTSCSLPALA